MSQISLITNTGIQFYKARIPVDLTQFHTSMHFREWFDVNTYVLNLEQAHFFSNAGVYVSKSELYKYDFVDNNGKINHTWPDIQNQTSDIKPLQDSQIISCNVNSLMRRPKGEPSFFDKFVSKWIPIPYFESAANQVGPYNWARMMIIPTDSASPMEPQDWEIVVAFDTHTLYDNGNYADEYREAPVFQNTTAPSKCFAFCSDERSIMRFISPKESDNRWLREYLLKLSHNTININNVPSDANGHKYGYLAHFVYFLNLIANVCDFPEVALHNSLDRPSIPVDLVVDMGNSKTTVVLFEDGKFSECEMLSLQDFTNPTHSSASPFDMNVAFRKETFGDIFIGGSSQFVHPSFVRLGEESKYLIYHAVNATSTKESYHYCSSPKRYLWDDCQRKLEWSNIILPTDIQPSDNIWVEGISNQFQSDGTLRLGQSLGAEALYSRKSLMTFAFLEILSQANRQINSFEYRHLKMGNEPVHREVRNIIVTCPTAMSRVEQLALRRSAAEACMVLKRFQEGTYNQPLNYQDELNQVSVIPSIRSLMNVQERTEWTYDEATCSQFVYLSAEIANRYNNNSEEFFDLYGKYRSDLPKYKGKSLTIGSLDIGAGTSDLMICAYEYQNAGQSTIKPIPLFWESFYTAGDDLLRSIIQQTIIEGPHSVVGRELLARHVSDITVKTVDFFGEDTNRMSFSDRQRRSLFNIQVSVPIAQAFLEENRKQAPSHKISWGEFFTPENQPNQELLDAFANHFGFRIEEVTWNYDAAYIDSLIDSQFDGILKKVASAMSMYRCDIVLLSGRPTSLKQIENIMLKYYPVAPNRLKVLNDYRVGRWYPFQNGDGYFSNQKSIVAVGALLGYIASSQGGYNGLSFNLDDLYQKLLPTTDYIGIQNSTTNMMAEKDILLTPKQHYKEFELPALPIKLGCRQLNTDAYPSRTFFTLDFNTVAIENKMRPNAITDSILVQLVEKEKLKIRAAMPLHVTVERDNYQDDKESVRITSVEDKDYNALPLVYFKLQVKSLSESEDFWMDSGAFKLSINAHNN